MITTSLHMKNDFYTNVKPAWHTREKHSYCEIPSAEERSFIMGRLAGFVKKSMSKIVSPAGESEAAC